MTVGIRGFKLSNCERQLWSAENPYRSYRVVPDADEGQSNVDAALVAIWGIQSRNSQRTLVDSFPACQSRQCMAGIAPQEPAKAINDFH